MSIDKKKIKKVFILSATAIGTVLVGFSVIAHKTKKTSVYKSNIQEKNPIEGKKLFL